MLIAPRRLAQLIDNAVTAASQGNAPFGCAAIMTDSQGVHVAAAGQHVLVEDWEPAEGGGDTHVVVLETKVLKDSATVIRKCEGATRKDKVVDVTCYDGALMVNDQSEMLVDAETLDGPDADDLLQLIKDAQAMYDAPVRPNSEVTVYKLDILAAIAKLKVADGEDRMVFWPGWAADTTMFHMGSLKGYWEGNRTPAGELF